jgi:hypothetical protein
LTASSRVKEMVEVRDCADARAVKSVRVREPPRAVRAGAARAELAARRREQAVNFMLRVGCAGNG